MTSLFHAVCQWRGVAEVRRWASMRFVFIALLALVGCRSADFHVKAVPSSYVSSLRSLSFSSEEVTTRKWTAPSGEEIGLLREQVFQVKAPQPLEILAATFGFAGSKRAACIDFYVVQNTLEGKAYHLLCHEPCPAYNTKITCETQDGRTFFTIHGEDQDAGASSRLWHQYSYELNPKWQMVRCVSEFQGRLSQ